MGVNNRDRRRQKKRREAAAERARERRRADAGPVNGHSLRDAAAIERALAMAVCAQRDRAGHAVLDLVDMLVEGPPEPGGQALVDSVVGRCVRRDVAAAGERGWERTVLSRFLRRRLGKSHGLVLEVLEVAPGGAFVDDLARRLRTDRFGALEMAIQVLATLSSLPPLPTLRSAKRRSPVDGRILKRVRALLAKAESTTFPEEAEALTCKAQELMARHAIDRALLESTSGLSGDEVSGRHVPLDDPYQKEKSLLLGAVARANRCKAVWCPDFGWSTVFGADDDLDIVELLFTSLLCQATTAMTAAGTEAGARARTTSFRKSFLVAYATRIGERLMHANDAATADAAETHGADRLLPVLAARRTAAEDAAREAFPALSRTRVSVHDPAGWAAGTAAAEVASLDVRRAVKDTAG